jgi:CRP-like cAMP-binding protein
MQTGRTFGAGTIIGQDDILYMRKRVASYKAVSMCQTMKLDRESFEMMCKEFPYIKKELLDDANFRALVSRKQNDVRDMIKDGQSKKVVRKFNELSQE